MFFTHLAPHCSRLIFPLPIYLAFSPNEPLEILPPLLPIKHLRDVCQIFFYYRLKPWPHAWQAVEGFVCIQDSNTIAMLWKLSFQSESHVLIYTNEDCPTSTAEARVLTLSLENWSESTTNRTFGLLKQTHQIILLPQSELQ